MALKDDLAAIPAKPGVYIMLDRDEKVLYVGKAASLRPRVRSYFQPSAALTPRLARMVEQVERVDFITTSSEVEALALECNLIKEHRPKYNVKLRDDKQYPWLKVTVGEDFPRVYIVRRPQKDGSRYFGPYTDAGALREIFRLLRKVFPIRTCKRKITWGINRNAPALIIILAGVPARARAGSPRKPTGKRSRISSVLEGKQKNSRLLSGVRWRRRRKTGNTRKPPPTGISSGPSKGSWPNRRWSP